MTTGSAAVGSDVVELTRRLVRVNTVNPPGNEAAAARELGAYLISHGIEPSYQELADGRANLLARLPGTGRRGHLVFSGHIDVVHPGASHWDHDPFAAELVDGRIVGRGSADMKGGVAAMAVAMTSLARGGFEPTGDLVLAISAGEEVDTAGARLMASTGVLEGSAGLIVGEPTGLDVFVAEKGVLWVKVVVRGHTAHGSMPHLGINAIMQIARLVPTLQANPFPFEPSEILGEPTVSVNTIHGGVKTNVVPDYCEMTVDMRTVPGQSHEGLLDDMQRLLEATARELGVPPHAEVEVLQNMPSVETSPDDPLVQAVVAAATKVRGHAPAIGGVSYGTDGAILAPALGAPLVVFGPGQPGQAHQPNEYVDVDELHAAVDAYIEIARMVLGA